VLQYGLLLANEVPRALYKPSYFDQTLRVKTVNTTSQPKQDCCVDSCCTECDPELPDIETPFWGTVHQMPNTITEEDGTSFERASYSRQAYVNMWDGTRYERTFAFIFSAEYIDGHIVEVAVHEDFVNDSSAKFQATTYSDVMGRVPLLFRKKITNLHLRPGTYDEGCNAWGGGGTVTLCTGVGEELLSKGNCEEVFVHEGCHISLDSFFYNDPAYRCAQNQDQMFISNYARDNRYSEDASESVLPWFATRFSAHRVPQETLDKITNAIPNRLKYFDENLNTENSECAQKVQVVTDDMESGPYQVWGPDNYYNIFGYYTLQPGMHNDHVWYLKDDNKDIKLYAAQYNRFHICPADTLDNENTGWAYNEEISDECVENWENSGFKWKFWNPDSGEWLQAGTNLYVTWV